MSVATRTGSCAPLSSTYKEADLRGFGCRSGFRSARAFQRRWEPFGPLWRAFVRRGLGFFRHLNRIALQVPHFKVLSSLSILPNVSNSHAPRTQEISRLLDVGSVQHRRHPIRGFATRPEGNGCMILFRKSQGQASLCVIHFDWNLLKSQLFDVPRGCSRQIEHSDIEGIRDG
jgi:hypothetical protein